jgi:hypothetical protein
MLLLFSMLLLLICFASAGDALQATHQSELATG